VDISFELVARDDEAVTKQLAFIESHLPFVNIINVPDLLRFPIRSWEVSRRVNREKYRFIPHFRAIDFDIKSTRLFDIIDEFALQEVLLVTGDPPPDMSYKVYDTRVLDLIEKTRERFPELKIYGGFDSYRSSVREEVQYMHDKLEAGADALFSQPFFDMRFLEIYGEHISGDKVYWGISPVIKEQSRRYWETMNNVVFPTAYHASYEWNTDFANQVLSYAARTGGSVYFMPIRIDLEKYFAGIKIR